VIYGMTESSVALVTEHDFFQAKEFLEFLRLSNPSSKTLWRISPEDGSWFGANY
jgi:hypothetical protein